MELKQLRKELGEEARKAGICQEWLEKIKAAPSREYLLFQRIKISIGIENDSNGIKAKASSSQEFIKIK